MPSQRLMTTMQLHVEVGDDPEENRRRFRQAYEDAEQFMFGKTGSERDYLSTMEIVSMEPLEVASGR